MKTVGLLGIFVLLVAVAGCGPDNRVGKGTLFIVTEDLREEATTQWEQPYSDGFTAVIPKGTVVEVLYSNNGTSYFEVAPVSVAGKKSEEEIRVYFVPEGIRTRAGFESFSFSLPVSYIGSKLERVEESK